MPDGFRPDKGLTEKRWDSERLRQQVNRSVLEHRPIREATLPTEIEVGSLGKTALACLESAKATGLAQHYFSLMLTMVRDDTPRLLTAKEPQVISSTAFNAAQQKLRASSERAAIAGVIYSSDLGTSAVFNDYSMLLGLVPGDLQLGTMMLRAVVDPRDVATPDLQLFICTERSRVVNSEVGSSIIDGIPAALQRYQQQYLRPGWTPSQERRVEAEYYATAVVLDNLVKSLHLAHYRCGSDGRLTRVET